MTSTSRRSRFHQTSGRRRAVSWSTGPAGVSGAISATSNNIFPTASQVVADDLTLVRTRGELSIGLTVAGGAAAEGFDWAFGMCSVTENASGVGVTAVPDALADANWDGWFVHEMGSLWTRSTTLVESSSFQERIIKIDSKAMRKLRFSDLVIASIGVTEIGAGSTMQAFLSTRILLKSAP